MSTTTCPNCGKPLRAGARFCGNCGATLPASTRPGASQVGSAPPLSDVNCPHCGKPVRQGARFCSNCGKSIDAPVETPAGASGASASGVRRPPDASGAPTVASAEARASGVQKPSASPSPAAPPRPAGSPARRRLAAGLTLAALAACVVLGGGGYLLAQRMGWLGGQPPAAASLNASPTSIAPVVQTATLPVAALPSETTLAVEPTSLPSLAPPTAPPPTDLPTNAPVQPAPTASPALVGPAPTLPAPSAAPTQTAALVLFDDPFDNGLRGYWRTWGSPRPTIDSGPGDSWLYLKDPAPGSGGVTTRPEFPVDNAPGAVYEFQAQLDPNYPQGMLIFDWDPPTYDRGPENRDPGLLRLEIQNARLALRGRLTKSVCTHEIDGKIMHTYTLRVLNEQAVTLTLDGQAEPLCRLDSMGLAPVPGSISFTGLGWITRVKIALPPEP